MKILITGGSGFIGTHLIRSLLKCKDVEEIINIDLKRSSIDDKRLTTIQFDIRSKDFTSIVLTDAIDTCIHLAALCKEPGFPWDDYFITNHQGTENTIAVCDKYSINNIIFTSTMMVYKAAESRRFENSITAPDTAYGISKLLAEKELESWHAKKANRDMKIIRPAVVFGENENGNFTRLLSSLKRGFFPFVGKSTTIKSNIYVKELVNFILFLIRNDTKLNVFNLGFPESKTIREIVMDFKRVFVLKSFNPVLPLKFLILLSYFFEFLNSIGLRNDVHHRRIEKLYYSTDIYPENALKEGYTFKYDLNSSLEDWKESEKQNVKVKFD